MCCGVNRNRVSEQVPTIDTNKRQKKIESEGHYLSTNVTLSRDWSRTVTRLESSPKRDWKMSKKVKFRRFSAESGYFYLRKFTNKSKEEETCEDVRERRYVVWQ